MSIIIIDINTISKMDVTNGNGHVLETFFQHWWQRIIVTKL